MITNLNELYGYVRGFADELRVGPAADLARMIDRALGGSTSGEILGDLWIALRRIEERGDLAGTLDRQAFDDSMDFIRRALGPPR